MTDLLEIAENTTKRIVDLPDGPVEIVRQKNETQLITGFLQPIVSILQGWHAGLAGSWANNRGRCGVNTLMMRTAQEAR